MRFTPDRCAHCSGPPLFFHSEAGLTNDGRLTPHERFFFCSDDCFIDELNKFIPTNLEFGKSADEDPHFVYLWNDYQAARKRIFPDGRLYSNEEKAEIDRFDDEELRPIERYKEEWATEQRSAIRDAIREMRLTYRAHLVQQQAQDDEKRREKELVAQLKQREKEQQAEEKRLEKEREAEARRQAERAEEEAEARAFEELITPRPIPEHLRIHTAIVAKTGWGKTQLLQDLILAELKKDDPPSMVILDSTGAMVDRLQRLAIFNGRLRDRLLIIDPAHSPALNMFDLSNPRFETYSAEQKENIQTELVSLFNYVFGAQDYDLSGQMGLAFAYSTRLMLSRPGSTIRDLRRLLEENPKRGWEESVYRVDIERLDEDAQDFFKLHFYADTLKSTKAGIARRLQLMIAIPAFSRMFLTAKNALDLFGETQIKGSIILVNTNEEMLKDGGYVLFGRYIIARLFAAIMERATVPRDRRRTTHLIIDEGSPYMDETFDALLTRVRQFGLKVSIAFQHFHQLSDQLKSAIAGQTSIKYAGGLNYGDARFLGNEMRCEADFLMNLRTDISLPPQWTEFAVYADNWTPTHPMKLRLPFYSLERQPMMTDQQHSDLLARNQRRVTPPVAAPIPETHKAPEREALRVEERLPAKTADKPIVASPKPQQAAAPKPTASPQADSAEPASDW